MKLRVLEVLASLRRAGAENMAASLVRRLDRDRFEPAVVTLFDAFEGGLDASVEACGVRVWRLGKRGGLDLRMYPRLAKVFREFRPDIVHSHSYVLRYALPAGLAAGVPVFVHTVHNLAEKEVDLVGRLLQRVAFRGRVASVAIADEIDRSFRALYGSAPTAVIPNGIETARFHRPEAREAWREAHGFSPCDLLVVSVARLDPQKDPLGLIEAFARGLGGDARCRLLMAGAGSLAEAAHERARDLGIAQRVHFLGVRADVPELLAAADIFALASRYEGNPLAVMEAMAAGLPVAATAVGAIPELVEPGITGELAPPGDMEALGRALAGLAQDAARRRAYAAAARERARRFDADRMTEAYSALFERLAGKGRWRA